MESFTSQFPTRETLIWNGSLPQCKVSWHGFIPYFTIHGSHLSLSSLSSPRGPGEEKSRWNEGRASVQVSRRFQSFGNSADKFHGHETNLFSLLPVSCKNWRGTLLIVHETPMKPHWDWPKTLKVDLYALGVTIQVDLTLLFRMF